MTDRAALVVSLGAALEASDDSARTVALQRALRRAVSALEDAGEAARAYGDPDLIDQVGSALHEARVALSLEHGEA